MIQDFGISGRLDKYYPADSSNPRHSIALANAKCSGLPTSSYVRVVIRYQCPPRLGSSLQDDLDAAVFEGMEGADFELECKCDYFDTENHTLTVDALAIKIVRPDPLPLT